MIVEKKTTKEIIELFFNPSTFKLLDEDKNEIYDYKKENLILSLNMDEIYRKDELWVKVSDLVPTLKAIMDNDKTVYSYDGDNSLNKEGLKPLKGKRFNTPHEIAKSLLQGLEK